MTPQAKSFNGDFLLFRKDGQGTKRARNAVHPRPPRFRHKSMASAEAEAVRLLRTHPDSTFIILQEVGRVKMTESIESDVVGTPARHSAWPGGKAY